jgi:hypothetical protein
LLADTTFYIGVSGDNYCENETGSRKAVTVTVYPELTPGSIGTSQSYCGIVPAISIGSPATGGTGIGYTYLWASSTDSLTWVSTGTTTHNYALNNTQTTWYYRSVTNLCGIRYSDTIKITVHPLPVVSAVSTDICVGNSTFLSSSTNGIWTSNNASVRIDNNNTAVGVSAGTATLTFTETATGCSENITMTVNTFPVVDEITGVDVVCIGETISISNPTPNGIWSTSNPSNVSLSPNANTVTVTGVSTGKSFVTYTVNNGVCQTKRTFQVKILPSTSPDMIIGIER